MRISKIGHNFTHYPRSKELVLRLRTLLNHAWIAALLVVAGTGSPFTTNQALIFVTEAFQPNTCLHNRCRYAPFQPRNNPCFTRKRTAAALAGDEEAGLEPSHALQRARNPSTGRCINISPFIEKGISSSRRRSGVWDSLMQAGGWIAYNGRVVPLFANSTLTEDDSQGLEIDDSAEEVWYILEPSLEACESIGLAGAARKDSSTDFPEASELPLVDELLWVCKPQGLLTLPGKTEPRCLSEQVVQYLRSSSPTDSVVSSEPFPRKEKNRKESKKRARKPNKKPWIPRPCHRLDKDTSGIIVVGKTREAYKAVSRQFEDRVVRKRYVALVEGRLADDANDGTIDAPIGSLFVTEEGTGAVQHKVWSTSAKAENPREARTRWRVSHRYEAGAPGPSTAPYPDYTRLVLYPKTGRGHQLRLHTAEVLGHPIVGDTLHGGAPTNGVAPRLCLHAEYLELWVRDGQDRVFRARCRCLPPF